MLFPASIFCHIVIVHADDAYAYALCKVNQQLDEER